MHTGALPSTDGLINPDEDLLVGIAELCQHRGIERGMALLVGALRGATVRPAPDATPVILTEPTWLVQATATVDGGQVALHGVVSWVDQGLPRMVAGQIESARSGGVRLQVLPAAMVAAKPRSPGRAAARTPAARAPAPRPEEPVAAPQPTPDPHIDLSETAAAITPKPAPTAGGGWGAAVAASKAARAPRSTQPAQRSAMPAPAKPAAKASGGWGAAVAASRSASRSGLPSPDELGFDTSPTLVAGDVLLHPRFGRCKVSRMIGKSKVKLRRPSGGLFDMHLKVCSFVREADEGDVRVFSVTIG